MTVRVSMFVLGLVIAVASGAAAQQTTPAVAEERQPTTAPPAPPQQEPSFVDEARQWADDSKIIERMNGTADGWYPRFGGIRRGSSLGGGPGYRFHAPGDVLVDLSAAWSIRYYRAVDASIRWLTADAGRAEL